MVYFFAFVFAFFLSQSAVVFSEEVTSQSQIAPLVAPLPDHVIIQHWKNRVASTKTFYAEFTITQHDSSFNHTTYGKGKLLIQGKKQCWYESIPFSKEMFQKMKQSQNKKTRKRKYSNLSHSIWLWENDDTLTVINPVEKSYAKYKVNDKKQKTNSSLFFNFDFSLSRFPWYQILSPCIPQKQALKTKVYSTREHYVIDFLPTNKSIVKNWSQIKIVLDLKTEQLKGIQITSPNGISKTTWLFSQLEINQQAKNKKNLLDTSLKGYHHLNKPTKVH